MTKQKEDYIILIIDDDPKILEILSEEFLYYGYQLMLASSGNEAIAILKKQKIDFVISDYVMPDGDGLSVLNYINTTSTKTPIIFASGQSTPELIEEAFKAGARGFFTKPFDCGELEQEISQILAEREGHT